MAKIISRILSNSIEEICKINKRPPPKYKYIYSFNNKIFSFNAINKQKNKTPPEIKDKNNLIKKKISLMNIPKKLSSKKIRGLNYPMLK